jgi:hypothetical protein
LGWKQAVTQQVKPLGEAAGQPAVCFDFALSGPAIEGRFQG